MSELKKIKYYKPIYCYRHFPSMVDIYAAIISDLVREKKKITLYESLKTATKVGGDMLCDDDTYDVAVFDFTCGYLKVSYIKGKTFNIIGDLDRWSGCYDVIEK